MINSFAIRSNLFIDLNSMQFPCQPAQIPQRLPTEAMPIIVQQFISFFTVDGSKTGLVVILVIHKHKMHVKYLVRLHLFSNPTSSPSFNKII